MSMTTRTTAINPRSAMFARAALCRFYFPCAQPSGDMRDYRGGASALKFDASFTDGEAWVDPGFATTGSSITDYFTRAADPSHDFSLSGNAVIIAGRIKKATPGSTEIIAGSFTSGSVNGGWQLTANSSGSLQLAVSPVDGSGNQTASISNTYAPLDGTKRTFVFAMPPDAVSVKQYVDGVAASTSAAGNASGKNCAGGSLLNIGASRAGSAKVCAFADLQMYVVPTATLAALRMDAVAQFIHRNPLTPVPDWMWGI